MFSCVAVGRKVLGQSLPFLVSSNFLDEKLSYNLVANMLAVPIKAFVVRH
jgi:hypothetical protein